MPQQWEGRIVRFDPNERSYHNRSSEYRSYGRYAYDGVEQRKWIFEDVAYNSPAFQRFEILELYKEKLAYVTNITSGECTIFDIEHPFHPHDIEKDAKFTGYENLGAYPDYLQLSQWTTRNATYHGQPNAHVYQTFTVEDCAPVRSDVYVPATGFHYEEFSDVTKGVINPDVWIPRSDCRRRN
eukprot:TRINITY_DN6532_c0_g1_i1.p1 TRINITY_DN6532_c0_g1~~TRINITY_DN6532_c0_g1_i1.p1  ORF type:complete len:215 (+),score=40.10 TRINITY_DN6532_c0_g1_i1:99-647(+)